MKCVGVENAVAVYCEPSLLLFIQPITTSKAEVASSDEDAASVPVAEAVRCHIKQWLPVHSLPDAVEVVNQMPFTRHGKYLSVTRQCSCWLHCFQKLMFF